MKRTLQEIFLKNRIKTCVDSVTFRYPVIISSGAHLTSEEINVWADDFARKY